MFPRHTFSALARMPSFILMKSEHKFRKNGTKTKKLHEEITKPHKYVANLIQREPARARGTLSCTRAKWPSRKFLKRRQARGRGRVRHKGFRKNLRAASPEIFRAMSRIKKKRISLSRGCSECPAERGGT